MIDRNIFNKIRLPVRNIEFISSSQSVTHASLGEKKTKKKPSKR